MVLLQAALQVTSINTQGRKVLTVSGKWNRLVICSLSDSHNSTEKIPQDSLSTRRPGFDKIYEHVLYFMHGSSSTDMSSPV